tara:strand:+ start:447 stop:932 length:486 start_codon:yes stop_codon:yes gene_type:complete
MSTLEERNTEGLNSLMEDVFLIQTHLAAYCHAVDSGTLDEVAELFHENAVMTPAYDGSAPSHGRKAIRDWYANYNTYFRSKQVQHLRHQIPTPNIQVNGDEATSRCYYDADLVDVEKNENLQFKGRYDDKLVKEGGRWVFMDRVIQGHYVYPVTNYQMLGE